MKQCVGSYPSPSLSEDVIYCCQFCVDEIGIYQPLIADRKHIRKNPANPLFHCPKHGWIYWNLHVDYCREKYALLKKYLKKLDDDFTANGLRLSRAPQIPTNKTRNVFSVGLKRG